jgi:hypothetical protein
MRRALAFSAATTAFVFGVLLPQLALAQGNSTADQFLPHLRPGVTRGIRPVQHKQAPKAPAKPAPDPPADGSARSPTAPEVPGHKTGE